MTRNLRWLTRRYTTIRLTIQRPITHRKDSQKLTQLDHHHTKKVHARRKTNRESRSTFATSATEISLGSVTSRSTFWLTGISVKMIISSPTIISQRSEWSSANRVTTFGVGCATRLLPDFLVCEHTFACTMDRDPSNVKIAHWLSPLTEPWKCTLESTLANDHTSVHNVIKRLHVKTSSKHIHIYTKVYITNLLGILYDWTVNLVKSTYSNYMLSYL